MTVATFNNKTVTTVAGPGTQVVFSYDFQLYDFANLVVTVNGTDAPFTEENPSTMPEEGLPNGGDIRLVTPADPGDIVVILRELPIEQDINYDPFDAFPAETHERALDEGILIDQQLGEQLDRGMQMPLETSTEGPLTLPDPGAPAGLAGQSIVVNEAEDNYELAIVEGQDGAKGDKGDQGDPGPQGDQGDQGDQGAQGIDGLSGVPYSFDGASQDTGDVPLAAGDVRFDDALFANVRFVRMSHQSAGPGNPDVADLLRTFDDSTTLGNRSRLTFVTSDVQNYAAFRINGDIINDSNGAITFPVFPIDEFGTVFTDNASLEVNDSITGDLGETGAGGGNVSGPVSASVVENAIAQWTNTGGRDIDDADVAPPTILAATGGILQPSTDATQIPVGTTAQRIAAAFGFIRGNSDSNALEYVIASVWHAIASLSIVQVWTAGQGKEVTSSATWATAWNISDSNDFNITAQVSGAAGNLPLPTEYLAAGESQAGEITVDALAANTAGIDPGWDEDGAIDLSAGGLFTLYYRIWQDGGTTRYRIAQRGPWA